MAELPTAQLIAKIAAVAGKSEVEVKKLIDAKVEKFSGLLSESGAAYIVAKELGVSLNFDDELNTTSIAKLEDKMNNVDLVVRVKHIFMPQGFEKGGKKGTLCNMIVEDNTGEIRLTLWNDEAKKIVENKIERGQLLLLKNCYVTTWQGKKQLNLGHNGELIVEPNTTIALAESPSNIWKLNELEKDMDNVDVYAKVVKIFDERGFENADRKGKVLNFIIADETAQVRAVAWNDLVDVVKSLKENEIIKIEGAYVKEGQRGIELHLGWKARIIENPLNAKITKTIDEKEIKRVPLSKLSEESPIVEIRAMVVELLRGNFYYNICPKCLSSIIKFEENFICNSCGQINEPKFNLICRFMIDDGTAVVRAVAFGKKAEEILGIDKEKLKSEIEKNSVEEVHSRLKREIEGKQFILQGNTRKNKRNGEIEFVVKKVLEVDAKKEAEILIKEISN